MKKLKYLILLCLFIPGLVFASEGDKINSIDVNITLDVNGNAHIKEVWDVYAGSGTEFYKAEYNLGNMKITNFKVIDENDKEFTFQDNWDINASLTEKAYKNGFYESSSGLELCWGKTSIGSHRFTISYDVSDFVFNTSDAQVLYWKVINEMEMLPKTFSAVITGPNAFLDTLDVWGYGYKGYAYVSEGKIMMSNEENTNLSSDNYAVLLVKFPLGTFTNNANNTYNEYETFDDVYQKAEENTFDYEYDDNSFWTTFVRIISTLFYPLLAIIIFIVMYNVNKKYKFGSLGKKIRMSEINMYRDIPCKKDVYRAFFLAQVYHLNDKNTDFFGTIFLKWLFEKKIEIKKVSKTNLFGKEKEEVQIILNNKVELTNDLEKTLYGYLITASKDNVLEENEFTKWSKTNYTKLFDWFDSAENYGRDLYVSDNMIAKTGTKYLISDNLKPAAIELAGLKKFLLEFSRIQEKEAIEVMLWKEYLMFAQIFGIADKVADQFKKLYPEVLEQIDDNISITDVILLNSLTNTAIVSASSARSAAQSYSGGGGGFSSGGGGGGSFGGGGGGGR